MPELPSRDDESDTSIELRAAPLAVPNGHAGAPVRTFLIADIRGYTRFTQSRGDEEAAGLTSLFASLARATAEAHGGIVQELRGDEALAVFDSPRSALRASVDLQEHCRRHTEADPGLPLNIGIGLDAGEAIPVEGGYRGAALNLAARLSKVAGPGETLVSEGVVHLARRVAGLEVADRGQVAVRGFEEPVHVYQIDFEGRLPLYPEAIVEPEDDFPARKPKDGLQVRKNNAELKLASRIVGFTGSGFAIASIVVELIGGWLKMSEPFDPILAIAATLAALLASDLTFRRPLPSSLLFVLSAIVLAVSLTGGSPLAVILLWWPPVCRTFRIGTEFRRIRGTAIMPVSAPSFLSQSQIAAIAAE